MKTTINESRSRQFQIIKLAHGLPEAICYILLIILTCRVSNNRTLRLFPRQYSVHGHLCEQLVAHDGRRLEGLSPHLEVRLVANLERDICRLLPLQGDSNMNGNCNTYIMLQSTSMTWYCYDKELSYHVMIPCTWSVSWHSLQSVPFIRRFFGHWSTWSRQM